ncbi:hypothetical protein HKX48_002063 [Thoreauomyces humboldtii]|nr:hypothetical protein HKX48_002063 [Thoreauomyces humboldtii]
MSSAVRTQEAYPLVAHPFSVTLPKRVSLLDSTASVSSKKKGVPARTVAPSHFLTASVPESFYGQLRGEDHVAEVVTVQGSAVYLYDVRNLVLEIKPMHGDHLCTQLFLLQLQRQQCLHSWSVPPGHLFSCPARYLPRPAAEASAPVENGHSAAVTDMDNEADASATTSLFGNVYAAIHAGTDIQQKDEKKTLWMWNVAEGREDAQEQALAAGKPDLARKFELPIHHLSTFVPSETSQHSYIVLLHTQGSLTVISRDMKTVATWKSAEKGEVVIWSTTVDSEDKEATSEAETWIRKIVMTILEHKGVFTLRTNAVKGTPAGDVVVELLSEVVLPLESSAAVHPVAFATQQEGAKLVVAYSNLDVKVYDTATASGTPLVFSVAKQFALSGVTDVTRPASLSLCPLDANYIAIAGSRGGVGEVLTIWDTKYGAMHLDKVLRLVETEIGRPSELATFHGVVSHSPHTGPVITVSTSRVASRQPVTFTSTVTLIPFHCPPLTLASVLGKLRRPLLAQSAPDALLGSVLEDASVHPIGLGMATTGPVAPTENGIDEWNAQLHGLDVTDREQVVKLITTTPITVEEFTAMFTEWMKTKSAALKAAQTADLEARELIFKSKSSEDDEASSDSVSTAPKFVGNVELSPTVVDAILGRCLKTPQTFWPSAVIKYLLRSGCGSSRSVSGGLLAIALENNDLSTAAVVLEHVADLSETEVVNAIKWTCDAASDPNREVLLARWGKEQVARSDAASRSKGKKVKSEQPAVPVAMVVKSTDPLSTDVDIVFPTRAQAQFLRVIFTRPRTDNFLVQALKQLDVTQLTLVLAWLHQVLAVSTPTVSPATGEVQVNEAGARSPLWWVWQNNEKDHRITEQSVEEWNLALDLLPLLVTAHLPTILHTPSLVRLVASVQEAVQNQSKLLSTLHARLRGPLHAAHAKKEADARREKEAALAKQRHQQPEQQKGGLRYKRMMEDVAGVEYQVEVYRF